MWQLGTPCPCAGVSGSPVAKALVLAFRPFSPCGSVQPNSNYSEGNQNDGADSQQGDQAWRPAG